MRGKPLIVPRGITGEELVRELELETGPPVIVLLGGAGDHPGEIAHGLESLVMRGIAWAASELGATVIDGGTDVGVMGMLDAGLGAAGHSGVYVGVAPAAKVGGVETGRDNGWPMGVHHTHAVLVDGDHFGDETRAMYELIGTLSQHCPSLAILIGGGPITRQELALNVKQGREVIVIKGSGRLADQVADALQWENAELGEITKSGRITVFEISESPENLAWLVRTKLEIV